jgi:hypothetical protein
MATATRLDAFLVARPRIDWSAPARKADWSVVASIAVHADPRRIHQALTLPEYLETWICLPDRLPDSSLAAFGEANGFRLVHSAEGRIVTSIAAYFLSRRLRALRLHWRKSCAPFCAGGLVDFRIREHSVGCVVEVRHAALASAEEFLWHQRLWRSSLQKLASLLCFA